MLIPSQLKKFIELLFENRIEEIIRNKYSIVLSTSMNFFDHTAHNYMHAVIEDLDMKYVGFFSPNIYDFLTIEKRGAWYYFFEHFTNCIEEKTPITRRYLPIKKRDFIYTSQVVPNDKKLESKEKRIIILTDITDMESNLGNMINRFIDSFKNGKDIIEIVNLHEIGMNAGCLGCCKCGFDNHCIHKDDFGNIFRTTLKNPNIIVNAAEIKDRFYSSKWKQYMDRCFHNGHTPGSEGTQMIFLISGPLSQIENLRQIISAQAECGFGNLVDVISDDIGESSDIDDLIYNAAKKALKFSISGYVGTPTFLKVGGYKIFRDMIYGLPGVIFRADYHFFKSRKMFDFPNKKKKDKFMSMMLGLILKSKKIRKEFKNRMLTGMIRPYVKKIKKIDFVKEKKIISESNSLTTLPP